MLKYKPVVGMGYDIYDEDDCYIGFIVAKTDGTAFEDEWFQERVERLVNEWLIKGVVD